MPCRLHGIHSDPPTRHTISFPIASVDVAIDNTSNVKTYFNLSKWIRLIIFLFVPVLVLDLLALYSLHSEYRDHCCPYYLALAMGQPSVDFN
jgi:hypothetical protein